MRPRQACLGMLRVFQHCRRLLLGFNEAEASLPRNELPSISLCDLASFEVLRALNFVVSKETENALGRPT